MTSASSPGPKPTTVAGGCLCGALRYEATFSDTHDFNANAQTCQCTQCRKQSGALFVAFQRVPWPMKWTSLKGTSTLREFSITPMAKRGFCTECGSWLYYQSEGEEWGSICLGTLDQEALIGEKGQKGGFGAILASGLGGHEWCENEIPGVTDDIPMLRRGQRNQQNGSDAVVVKAKL
ncbi:glutathione-dependent formaldehyde-activating enzyme [Colletotrichum melonis]|uniref:Glutathione-dependent formaldehyde-activating enzyme n=3 Tax=Colletotrichum acutatum species complex TaxID=2707335 RepID=A0AAI9USU1_9PEZI|nr:glutathione-dependent formaldehyde-activating enzyme [Colletotrichum tamarilloi]KAI3539747.1 glutathione-dependent formaldehyde-activating enzyme [Colletotrichum filicis]KAK0369897.1 glutathione-dependent formaldehyde-activating enzyme [Colletotrichum limetticola]KAK1464087.1 glutathione-dependent formaldehyde-activating enzyme [Colletotrichum melonis]KAK1484499.1 glutathione-dependent formaldehyde-activating enzyme [Colletotrichum tamarilloi]